MSSDKHNQAIPSRLDAGNLLNQSNLRGLFGNNSILFMPTTGTNAGNAYLFGMGPMEGETTGSIFTPERETFFLSVQYPGEVYGIRQDRALETRKFAMKITDGKDFVQNREVPLGSN